MQIVCRKEEILLLESLYSSKKSEFLAVYGRRRVGKTYLIREFFKQKKTYFLNVTGTKDGLYNEQLDHFTQRVGEVFLNGITPKSVTNWNEAFRLLTDIINNLAKNKKVIIFIDELPWMATKKSNLLQTIDYYWNQYWSSDKRVKLIVCGSSASWIINKIIHNKGGLYNRVTETIHLKPFTLKETEQYLISNKIKLNKKQITELYMVTGGIPFYLSKINKGYSSTQIIEKLAFNDKALLLDEFNNLFASLFDNSEVYLEIIRAIASIKEGIGQEALFKKLKKTKKGSSGLERLQALEDVGFIESFIPYGNKQRGIYYRVIDEYVLFYLYWIAPLQTKLIKNSISKGYWNSISQTPKWFSWAGYSFESICYKHVSQIRAALELPLTAMPYSWRYAPKDNLIEEGAQIDLLFDRDDDAITICEIKYTNKPFIITKDYYLTLLKKIRVFQKISKTKKQIFVAFISANGIKSNQYSDELVDRCVCLGDLFL